MRRADLSSFLAEVSTTPLFDAAGTYSGAVAVVSDVSDRNRAEAEARYRTALLDAIGEAVLAARPDGTIVYANPAAEQLFGWRAAELIGQNGLDLLSTPETASISMQIHSNLLAKKRQTGEVTLTRQDGSHFLAHLTGAPVLDDHGELVGVIGVLSDSTERAQLEHDVRMQEQQAEMVALLGARSLQHHPTELGLVLTETVEAIRRVLQTDFAALLEVVPGCSDLAVRMTSPEVDLPATIPSGSRSLAGYTVLAATVVVVEDARRDRRFDIVPITGQPPVVSAVAAPVFGPSGVRGVLTAVRATPHAFDRSAMHYMQSLANIVGTALERNPFLSAGSG
jgi:PAS domain S-box-containing protein